ncbi:MAG: double-strand break repair helicase AddA [Alphaproteobacteria bacterium]
MSPPVDELTIETQRRAANPKRSAWVSANAGAGKTRVLTDRVARLLLAGVEPGRILCLTFTKAAAAEMLHRLYAMLAEWAVLQREALEAALTELTGAPPDSAQMSRARVLFAQTLDAPGGLRIQTIHSFCQDLLSRFPLEAGVTPGFEIQDERTAAELLQAARDAVFRKLNGGGGRTALPLEGLTRDFSEYSLAAFLTELTGKRGRLRDALSDAGGLKPLLAAIHDRLDTDEGASPEALIEAAFSDGAFALAELRQAASILAGGSKTEQQTAEAMHPLLSAAERPPHFERYRSAFFTKAGAPKVRLLNNGTRAAHPQTAAALEAEQARLVALDEACRSARLAQMTETALGFADAWFDAYEQLKHERGALDYEDLILETRSLLKYAPTAAWVLFKMDQSIDHVLVDEAQDTAPEQWDVITKLTEDFFAGKGAEGSRTRTVFAVGDEKQSIYGFQGAAPELFQATARTVAAKAKAARLPWSSETLDLSFRSLPAILEAVDHVFSREEAAQGLTFDGEPVKHRAWRGEGTGLVEVWPLIKPEKAEERPAWDAPLDRPSTDDPKAMLAARIADAVQGWLESGESVHGGDADTPLRPVRPGDILILVRRRDRLVDEMIRAFRERNIPVAGTDRLSLTDHIAVMDLMAAAQTALLPEDDLTLAALLKSPLCGLDDDALFDLAHDREGSLWQALQGGNSGPAQRARALVAWLIEHRDLRPFDFFSRLLTEREGRAALLARLGPDAADPIEEFLNQALAFERSHTPALQGFLHWMGSTEVQVKREMDQRADEVRIMTVHGAKGLQSNVVILPDTCTVPTARNDPSLLTLPAGEDALPAELPVMAPVKADDCAATSEARAAYARKRDAEFRRLLYVALTRARDRLYVCGYETAGRSRSDSCWYDLVRDALAPHARETPGVFGEPVLRLGEAPPPALPEGEDKPSEPATFPLWADRPPSVAETAPRRLPPSALAASGHTRTSASAEQAAVDAAQRGTLIHRLLELLPALPAADHRAAAERLVGVHAPGLPSEERERLVAETLAVLNDDRFAPVFGPGSLAEVAVAGTLPEFGPGFALDGRIDRLLVTKTRILAVDFKTGAIPDENLIPEEYVAQMAAYRALLRRIWPDREVECALLWTRGPALTSLPGERMDAALRAAAARLAAA